MAIDCKHEQFRVGANINRIVKDDDTQVAYYSVDLRLNCNECGTEFEWQGLPNGFSPYQPTVSIDGKELRISAMPEGEMIPSGLPGFKVTQQSFVPPGAVKN